MAALSPNAQYLSVNWAESAVVKKMKMRNVLANGKSILSQNYTLNVYSRYHYAIGCVISLNVRQQPKFKTA